MTAPDLLRLLRVEVAAAPGQEWNMEVLSRTVVNWWLRHHVPARAWPEPVLREFREQVVRVLQDDPLLQALVQKLIS